MLNARSFGTPCSCMVPAVKDRCQHLIVVGLHSVMFEKDV